jgi:hypothetical protein
MAPQYTISLYSSTGLIRSISQDYLSLAISRTINAPDIMQAVYDSNSNNAQYLLIGAIVTVTRVDTAAGISASTEFSGIIRQMRRVVNDRTTYEITAVGMMAILGDRIVAYPANILNRSLYRSTPAEDVLKNMFNYNIGSSATVANGRLINGVVTGMTTTASAGTGTSMSIGVAGQNLLSAMQKVADDGGGDFSLSYTAPATWVFAWHLGQLGTDRTATVKLSVPLGTIGELIVDDNRVSDFTATIVGGTGEGKARRYATRPATLPTGRNLREFFVDARNEKKATLARLQQIGQIVVNRQGRRRTSYTATLLQNAALRYGRDYFLGDLVTILDGTTEVTQKVSEVALEFSSEGQENVDVTLSNP